MKIKWKAAALVMSAALSVCACAHDTVPEAEQTTDKKNKNEKAYQGNLDELNPSAYGNVEGLNLEPGTYISIIGKDAGGEYWKAVEKGAQQAVKDINTMLGYEGDKKVKMVYSGPAKSNDVDEQVNILDEELARYPDAVGISIIDSQSCDVQFDLATENNIPIVAFDSASGYQGIMAKVSTDNAAAAATAAARLAEAMDESGEVMIFMHDSRSETSQEREKGFVQEMQANHPGITIGNTYYMDGIEELKKTIAGEIDAGAYVKETGEVIETAAMEETDESAESDATATDDAVADENAEKTDPESITDEEVYQYIFAKNPNIRGIYATNGDAVMTMLEACENQEKEDIQIAGFDADEEEIEALMDRKLVGLAVQNPYGMGYATVVAAARSILNMGNEAVVDSGFTWVNQKNIEDEAVQRLLY